MGITSLYISASDGRGTYMHVSLEDAIRRNYMFIRNGIRLTTYESDLNYLKELCEELSLKERWGIVVLYLLFSRLERKYHEAILKEFLEHRKPVLPQMFS